MHDLSTCVGLQTRLEEPSIFAEEVNTVLCPLLGILTCNNDVSNPSSLVSCSSVEDRI